MEFKANLSGADLEKLTADAVQDLRDAERTVGRDIARASTRAILDNVRGRRRGGLRFGRSRLDAVATQRGNRVEITAVPAGAWSIVEYGSRDHDIRPRQARALHFDGRFAMRVDHPGTVGMRFWAGAEHALEQAVTPVVEDGYDEAMGVT